MKSFVKNYLIVTIFILSTFSIIKAQEISLGTDIVSRYIWRGMDLGANAPSIQPDVNLSIGGLTVGFWGAYSTSNFTALDEVDFYINYSFNLAESGSISLGVVDYMNPNSGVKLGNLNNYDHADGPGAHYIELNAAYSGPESFPLSLSFNYFLHNVFENPIYLEVGYSTGIGDVGFDLFVGTTPGDKGFYYGVENFSIVNLGFKASKEIKITESFNLPISGSVIFNPAAETMFYVLGVSF